MQQPKSKKLLRLLWIPIVMLLCIALAILTWPTLPDAIYHLVVKTYVNYELAILKYPNSQFVEAETSPAGMVTMATHYIYRTSDDLGTVLAYMEQKQPGFVHSPCCRVINQSNYRNSTFADETIFNPIFSFLGRGEPGAEINIYPDDTGETMILIIVYWDSMGFPSWLRSW